jgi:hypothetical protein
MINISRKLFFPLLKDYINFTYEPVNTFLFNNVNEEIFTVEYVYDHKMTMTGYEAFGFMKFDNYLSTHHCTEFIYDFKDRVAYGLRVPEELRNAFFKFKRNQLRDLYIDDRRFFSYDDFNLTISKTYETFYYDKGRIYEFKG